MRSSSAVNNSTRNFLLIFKVLGEVSKKKIKLKDEIDPPEADYGFTYEKSFMP